MATTNGISGESHCIPPSTLAAQLAESHAHPGRPQQPGDEEALTQLLAEIRTNPETLDADVESIHVLISVISNAALPPTHAPDNVSTAERQLAGIQAIEIAFRRNPGALFHSRETADGPDDQLCLQLLPRLFSLIVKAEDPDLTYAVESLLVTFQATFRRDLRLTVHSQALQELYLGSAEDVLHFLDMRLRHVSTASTRLVLPSNDTRCRAFPQAHTGLALSSNSRVDASDTSKALFLVSTLARVNTLCEEKFDVAIPVRYYDPMAASRIIAIAERLYQILLIETNEQNTTADGAPLLPILRILSPLLQSSHLEKCDRAIRRRVELLAMKVNLTLLSLDTFSLSSIEDKDAISRFLVCSKHLASKSARFSQGLYSMTSIEGRSRLREVPGSFTPSVENDFDGLLVAVRDGAKLTESPPGSTIEERRPSKRQKGAHDSKTPQITTKSLGGVLSEICSLFGEWDANDITRLHSDVENLFSDLSETQQIRVLSLMQLIFCGCTEPEKTIISDTTTEQACFHCGSQPVTSDTWTEQQWDAFYRVLCSLAKGPSIQASKSLRVLFTATVGCFAWHTPIRKHLDFNSAKSPLGAWCLHGLRSSYRELRQASAHLLPTFCRSVARYPDEICLDNRKVALQYLREIAESSNAQLAETLITALVQLAPAVGDTELNLILLKMVDFLGHKNPLICSLAHVGLREIADSRVDDLSQLLVPFWDSIAIRVVQDLPSKPQKLQQLADLLGYSANMLLLNTQCYTVPYLVLWKQGEVLRRIAQARGEDATVWSLCMTKRNMTSILAHILAEHPMNAEAAIMDCLSKAHPEFGKQDPSDLLRSDPIALACEVLKLAADRDDEARQKALQGFRELTSMIERRGHSTRTSTTQARMTTLFFENHALGIMQSFSDAIDNPNETVQAKRRCLNAIQQMITIGGAEISVALPQIRSCLYSALDTDDLLDQAFTTWMTLVSALVDDEDLLSILENTFVIVAQHWDGVSSQNQIRAHDVIGSLIKDHQSLIQDFLYQLPSFGSIAMMSKYENQIRKLRESAAPATILGAYIDRLENENSGVVKQALIELRSYLEAQQLWVYETCAVDQPDPVIASLLRCLLDIAAELDASQGDLSSLVVECLGRIGAVDPSRVEEVREKHELVILSNFEQAEDALEFVAHVLEHVLVKAFNSVANSRAQGFLAYTMQELLKFCGFSKQILQAYRPHGSQADGLVQRWQAFTEPTRNSLTPFLSSKYVLTARQHPDPKEAKYPIFTIDKSYGSWIKELTFNLMLRAKGSNANKIFSVLARIIKGSDSSIAAFMLPFVAANVITGGNASDSADIVKEMRVILETEPRERSYTSDANLLRQASDTVFQIYDYLSKWLHDKRKEVSAAKTMASRTGKPLAEDDLAADENKIRNVENILTSISAKSISNRATAVGSSTRALLHWEVYIRQQKGQVTPLPPLGEPDQDMFQHLHSIYKFIDEPDGLEGISAHIKFPLPQQRAFDYQRAGNWTAAESWFESFQKDAEGHGGLQDLGLQEHLVSCLSKAGKQHAALDHIIRLPSEHWKSITIQDAAAEACWRTENWALLDTCVTQKVSNPLASFHTGVGFILNAIRKADHQAAIDGISALRIRSATGLNPATTTSINGVHSSLLHLQCLEEIELICGLPPPSPEKNVNLVHTILNKRLDVVGSHVNDKQYLLGIRRAAMHLRKDRFSDQDVGSLWMTTARLSRKSGSFDIAHKAAVNAIALGDSTAVIEEARYIWKMGEHRKAIQSLERIIASGSLRDETIIGHPKDAPSMDVTISTTTLGDGSAKPTLVEAKAHLLLAKWLDASGQTSSIDLNAHYQKAANSFNKWEKGYYYLGKFYNKLLEAEQKQPPSKQEVRFLTGENAKLVIENYLRSLIFGCKYISETMPKLLTLWLDAGAEVLRGSISKEIPEGIREHIAAQRPKTFDGINRQVKKYGEKVASCLFYTALNQMLTRIGHSNHKVYEVLAGIIARVIAAHPQQGLWALLAVVKSSKPDRANRGISILGELKKRSKNIRHQSSDLELKNLIAQGQRLADALLDCCNRAVDGRISMISLRKDLKFNPSVAPCALVVPWEETLLPNLSSLNRNFATAKNRAFPMSRDAITIQEFQDEVLVLSSLQRPRKLVVRGSNGKKYGLLCKPKDDLRKDQRLMEFNTMINRSLKKDSESLKRRLYIRTYAVTPLNEECGAIEWVEGLKPLRDILITTYKSKGIRIDYALLKELLGNACDPKNKDGHLIFTNQILAQYAPALHEWFTELFPSPDAWFTARTRYTRSCAVMSMSGHVLGLGDRHGENVLLEEGSGGVFHVDFNCLFDKGLTFEKPELVPFRLTHNMVDAFGAHGVEGPFRRSAECTMSVMRAVEGALLTIMETFVYDPTADFVGSRRRHVRGVPETPREVLDSVSGKVRGLMKGDSVPLSVEGHVDRLIAEARDPKKLAAMYIGWCAFL